MQREVFAVIIITLVASAFLSGLAASTILLSSHTITVTTTDTTSTAVSSTTITEGATKTGACTDPGVFCGPGFSIVNASLVSASTAGGNASVLTVTLQITYPDQEDNLRQFAFLLSSNTNPYEFLPLNNTVGSAVPNWQGTNLVRYVFNIPATELKIVVGHSYEMQVDGYFEAGPLKSMQPSIEVLEAR